MAAFKQVLPAVFSSLFRLFSLLFLRVVPSRLAKTVLPALYLLYLGTSWFSFPDLTKGNKNKKKPEDASSQGASQVPDPPESLIALLFTLPSSRRLHIANIGLNTLLLLAIAEFVAYPLFDNAANVVFTRVGAVYPDGVKLVVRYPQPNLTEHDIRVVWRKQLSTSRVQAEPWRDGPIVTLQEVDDWVNTVKLGGLWPSTSYEYRLSSIDRTMLPYPSDPIRFHTFPDARLSGTHFRFIVSSCVTPNFPYVPLHGQTIKGFDLLARYLWPAHPKVFKMMPTEVSPSESPAELEPEHSLHSSDAVHHVSHESSDLEGNTPLANDIGYPGSSPITEFLMFLGDFIYADVPVYFGDDKEAYRRLYRRNYQSPSFRKIYERLPVFHTYDDHEIINNFAGLANDSTPPFPNASDAFWLYNAHANYNTMHDQYYYDFQYGDVAFFVMDTRRYRSDVRAEDLTVRTMLGDKQLAALYSWLGKVNTTSTFKFLVTSVPFTSLWGHDAVTDAWAGYAHEKTNLLDVLHSIPNVVILSGDRHEFAHIEFNSGDEGSFQVREFSTSPMSMFYVPFFRTLRMKSEEVVRRIRNGLDSVGGSDDVRVDEIPKERVLKYIGAGNFKWSAIEVDTRNLEKPILRLEVMIDGSRAYEYRMVGTSVKLQSSTALGAFVPQSFKGMLDRIGIKSDRWF